MAGGFDIRDGRAMVSLGPLSPKRFCTYACEHCYVHVDFPKYPSSSVSQIVEFLEAKKALFDIVYVSGDTDSFAKPRTEEGIDLLDALSELKKDVVFTTRAPLSEEHTIRIGEIRKKVSNNGNLMFGCVSISRFSSASHVEPKPIPSPEIRAQVLHRLHKEGLIAVLAIRPFLPIIPIKEYVEIVERCKEFTDVILGESWYCDTNGVLEDRVLGKGNRITSDFELKEMDFDGNNHIWKVYNGTDTRTALQNKCDELNIPFFMRSAPAIEYFRRMAIKG